MNNFPEKLYKFTRKKYALEMVIEGKLRVGTLHNFQNEDKYGLEIGDSGEGTQSTIMAGKTISIDDPKSIPPPIRRMIESGRLKLEGNLTVLDSINENINNTYIYSLTTDKNLIRNFGANSAGYDSIVEINNVHEFIRVISEELHRRDSSIRSCVCDYIEYIARKQTHEKQTSTHPIFIKDPKHSWQKEYRLVWETLEREISPINIQSFELKKYIKLL